MKKSLSLLLAIAMVFSLFAGVASAADNGKTALEKFNELKAKGIFAGIDEQGTPGLDQPMTRAQYARVAALILGLQGISPNGDTKVVTEKPFKDVELDAWFVEEVAAVKEAGIMVGNPDGTFNPNGNITVQELAVVTAQSLGLTPVEDAKVEGADDWAAGYIQALLNEGINFPTNYKEYATRAQLVEVAYQADQKVNPVEPAVASIKSAKAIGVYKVEVQLDKAVDTTKATLSLARGNAKVSAKTVWSNDGKSAVLETDTRIVAGEYTVTLGGLSDSEVGTKTFTFTAEDEKVTKLDFVTASDYLPYSVAAAVEVRAENQYGEPTSLGVSNFTALVSGQAPEQVRKNEQGNIEIIVNVKKQNVTQGNGLVPITIYLNNSNVMNSKTFQVGTVPILTKIEAGEVTYSNKSTNKLTAAGDKAEIALKFYDQYGNPLVKKQFEPNGSDPAEVNPNIISAIILPYEENLEVVKAGGKNASFTADDLFDDEGNPQLTIKLASKIDKNQDYTVNIYGAAQSATATISVGAGNLATKIEFDTSSVVLAANDSEVLIPVIAYDANGNKLSEQDIADNEKANRFSWSASNADTIGIVLTGKDKGKLRVKFKQDVSTGNYNPVGSRVYVSGQIPKVPANTFVQTSIVVSEPRVPDHIVVKDANAPKAILGASDDLQFELRDQYGKAFEKNISSTWVVSSNGQQSQYRVVVEVSRSGAGVDAVPTDAPSSVTTDVYGTKTTYTFGPGELSKFKEKWSLTSTAAEGKVTVKAKVQRSTPTSDWSDYSSTVTRTFESIKWDTKLTYELKAIGDLFAAKDKLTNTKLPVSDKLEPETSKFAKKLEVIAKTEAGEEVKLPKNFVRQISSSDPNVLLVGTDPDPANEDGYVLGNKAGTATVQAVVYTNVGNTIFLSQQVTVKADPIAVDSITVKETSYTFTNDTDVEGKYAYELFKELKVKDQYGIEYISKPAATNPNPNNDNVVANYDAVLGIRYAVEVTSGDGRVDIDAQTGEIVDLVGNVDEFIITVMAPNGKSATILVARQ